MDNVACTSENTFSVWCSDAAWTRVVFEAAVVRIDDADDVLFVTVDRQSRVLTCRGAKRCTTYSVSQKKLAPIKLLLRYFR